MLIVSELLDWLKADEADYETVESLLAAAVAHVENETGMTFQTTAEVVQSVLSYGGPVALQGTPADGEDFTLERWTGSAWETVDSTSYYVDGAFVRPATSWAFGSSLPIRFRATYTTGYTDGQQPEPIKLAVKLLVQMWFDGMADEDARKAVRNLLTPYTRVVV